MGGEFGGAEKGSRDCSLPRYTELLLQSFAALETNYHQSGLKLPQNSGRELKNRKLDCLVINNLDPAISGQVQTVRGVRLMKETRLSRARP